MMFSANENIVLRQQKRRVTEFIESTIPENALELGTSVMVMQVSCRQPGCVPLETAITIIFPKPVGKKKKKSKRSTSGSSSSSSSHDAPTEEKEDELPSFPQPLIPDLEESRIGGSFKTRILKPLAEVTLDDVLEALPPNFKGGKKTVESICLKARDMMFAQIGQLVGVDDTSDNKNGRRLVAQYLKACLDDYEKRDYVAPEWGEEFSPLDDDSNAKKKKEDDNVVQQTETMVMNDKGDGVNNNNDSKTTTMDAKWGKGNIVFRRPDEGEDSK